MSDEVVHRNLRLTALEAGIVILTSLAQYKLLTHFFPESAIGAIAVASTWMFLIVSFSMADGITSVVTREIAQRRDPVKVVTNGVISELMLLPLATILSVFLFTSMDYRTSINAVFFAVTLPMMASLPIHLSGAILGGFERMTEKIKISIVAHLLGFSCLMGTIYFDCPLWLVGLANSSSSLILALLYYRLAPVHRWFSFKERDSKHIKFFLKQAFPSFVVCVATSIYVRIDVLMIESLMTSSDVAQYTAAYSILDNLMILAGTLVSALPPTFARLASEGEEGVRLLYVKIMSVLSVVLSPIVAAIAFFAPEILLHLYGPSYVPAAESLKFLMLAGIFGALNGPSGIILFSYHKQALYMWGALFAVVVNILLNLWLIPLMGYSGAALATAATEFALCIFSFCMIYRVIGYVPFTLGVSTLLNKLRILRISK